MSAGGSEMDDLTEETTRAAPLRQPKGELKDELKELEHFFSLQFYFTSIH